MLKDEMAYIGGEISLFPKVYDKLQEPMVTYKIKPDYTIDNSNNDTLVHSLASMYLTPRQRVSLKEGSFITQREVYFDIIFRHKRANFYFTVPEDYSEFLTGKMKTIWNKAEISKTALENVNSFDIKNTELCEMVLKDYNFKSLSTDRSNLYPLTNMIGITKLLKEGEQVRVNVAIEPTKRQNWISIAKDEFKSYKQGKIVDNDMSSKEKAMRLGFKGVEAGIQLYIDFKMLLFESIFGIVIPDKKDDDKIQKLEIKLDSAESIKKQNELDGLTPATTYKMIAETFKTRITIMSESKDTNRAKLNMVSVANSYKDISGNNELVCRLLTKKGQDKLFNQVRNFDVPTSKICVLADKEIAKLIQLPQRDLQNEYNIENIDTREVDIPKELQGGQVRIAIANKQGKRINATWSQDKNVMALAKMFVGAQNVGKTTALKRTVKDCYKAGYSNIVIDFIESCEVAREVSEVISEKDKVIIKLGEKDLVPSLAYNEVSRLITEDMDSWERVRLANLIAEQVEYLINAITDKTTGELTAPMLRYLHSACMVTFIRPNAKIQDVFDILRRWDKRNEAIRYAKYSKCFDEDDDIFFDLNELHKRDSKDKIIGTREDLIVGITNRVTILQKNPYLKAMLKADIDTSQDFAKYIEQGKNMFIMIPQNLFPNVMIRDILTTFFISRIWLTVQMRENNKDARLCNVVFDEVHQVPTTARFLANHVTEFRRHRLGLMLTCHYLKQLRDLLDALKSSGVSYVLIAGTEKENLEMLKEEIAPFTIEEGLNLKPHTSINIINYGNQYAKFIGQLPPI